MTENSTLDIIYKNEKAFPCNILVIHSVFCIGTFSNDSVKKTDGYAFFLVPGLLATKQCSSTDGAAFLTALKYRS